MQRWGRLLRAAPALNRETSSKLAQTWLSNQFAAVLPREADPEAGSGTGVDGCGREGMVD